MPRISQEQAGSRNMLAFLDTIAYAEIGRTMLADPRTDDGYKVIVGSLPGRLKLMDSYDDHPRKLVRINARLSSTAAGRYQILARFWDHYKRQLKLPDFGPESQDRYAIQQIREQRALDDVHAGRFDEAVRKVANIWASFPGAGYNQPEKQLEELREAYRQAGGRYAGEAPDDEPAQVDQESQLDRIEAKVDQLIALQQRDGGS